MSEVTVELPAGSDWTSEEATIAGVTGQTVIYGPFEPLLPSRDTVVYEHVVQIRLHPHAAHEWPKAMELLAEMCGEAVMSSWVGALKYACYVSRDGRKGVIITERIVFTGPNGITQLKNLETHEKFVKWLTEGEPEGRANWTPSDTPLPMRFA